MTYCSSYALFSSGGTAANTTVLSGGYELASSGAMVSGATLSGGTAELENDATGAGTFTFVSNGTLTLDGTGTYGMFVAGFTRSGAVADFTGVNFAGARVSFNDTGGTTSGILTVSNGGNVANITLLGNYTAATFVSANDGHGGTIVYDPPASSANPVATPHG